MQPAGAGPGLAAAHPATPGAPGTAWPPPPAAPPPPPAPRGAAPPAGRRRRRRGAAPAGPLRRPPCRRRCSGPCASPAAGLGLRGRGGGNRGVKGQSNRWQGGSRAGSSLRPRRPSVQQAGPSARSRQNPAIQHQRSRQPSGRLTCVHAAVPGGVQHRLELQVVRADPHGAGAHHRVQRAPVGRDLQQHALRGRWRGVAARGGAARGWVAEQGRNDCTHLGTACHHQTCTQPNC